jgi:predicted aldo/keto reductase-like oxidoreductase
MEFCQIQLNYLDWTLQDAKAKYELLTERNIPIWVMEPVRGGKLAKIPESFEAKYKELRPEESVAAWGFRFLQGLSGIHMILSGMSNLDQMKDNVKTFAERKSLTERELSLAFETAGVLKNSVPCTACRYCVDGCPMGLDIPTLLGLYNELRFLASTNVGMRIEAFPENKRHTACISCGKCARVCPQNIDIPTHMHDAAEMIAKIPRWENICREREAAMKAKS